MRHEELLMNCERGEYVRGQDEIMYIADMTRQTYSDNLRHKSVKI